MMWYSDIIYDELVKWLQKRNWYDDTIEDLIWFNKNYAITPSYNPIIGRTWTTEYDWLAWYEDISVNSIEIVKPGIPMRQKTTYFTNEPTITFNNHTMDIEWHRTNTDFERLMEYFYKACFGTKTEILFRQISRV